MPDNVPVRLSRNACTDAASAGANPPEDSASLQYRKFVYAAPPAASSGAAPVACSMDAYGVKFAAAHGGRKGLPSRLGTVLAATAASMSAL